MIKQIIEWITFFQMIKQDYWRNHYFHKKQIIECITFFQMIKQIIEGITFFPNDHSSAKFYTQKNRLLKESLFYQMIPYKTNQLFKCSNYIGILKEPKFIESKREIQFLTIKAINSDCNLQNKTRKIN
jgi:hypothetical protein